MRICFVFLFIVFLNTSFAQDPCERLLGAKQPDSPSIRISGSGQTGPERLAQIQDAAKEIYEVALNLGLYVPNMDITMLNPADLAALIGTLGHPRPHWHDGASIVGASGFAAGVLEFVEAGSPAHKQYIRDTNSFEETLLVLAHVAGHYDFSGHSTVRRIGNPDRLQYSYELAKLMQKLYVEYDKTEVSTFYQRLLSLASMQNMARGTVEDPAQFEPKPLDRRPIVDERDGRVNVIYKSVDHPAHPTTSMLQAFVKNLPPTAQPWQRQMALLFEKLHRSSPSAIQTKTMNEGWASMTEFLLLVHSSSWGTSKDLVEFGQIHSGIGGASLSNPYWLGLQGWMRIRERFLERSEIKNLSPVEQDKAFVQEAHRIIAQHTDFTFLQMALDAPWVEKLNLLLFREEKISWWDTESQNLAITRDPERVIRLIAQRTNFDLQFPQVELVSLNAEQNGMVLLRHKPVLDIPLSRQSVSKALYVLARFFEKPVSLETIGSNLWEVKQLSPWNFWNPQPAQPQDPLATYSIKITVRPNGKVHVEGIKDTKEHTITALQERLQKEVDLYRMDLSMSYTEEQTKVDQRQFGAAVDAAITNVAKQASDRIVELMSHAPTAAEAMLEYVQTVKLRLTQSLRLAVQGKWPIKFTKTGVRIRVLPEIPEFQLDERAMKKRNTFLPQTLPDERFDPNNKVSLWDALTTRAAPKKNKNKNVLPDEDLEIGQGPYLPGERWKSKKKGKGEGEEGEGEGEESEGDGEGEGEGGTKPGKGSGKGGSDVGEIEIPIELYGEILAQELELRNLRRTRTGDTTIVKLARQGGIHKLGDDVLWERTAPEAIAIGMALAKKAGKDPRKMSKRELLTLGLKYLQPEDYVVAAKQPKLLPDTKAVVVYIADTSGSMTAEHRKIQRKLVANQRALLKAKYKKIHEVFIIYDTAAKEVTEQEFFSNFLGGGTNAVEGIKLAQSILQERFPQAQFNRYAQIFSDGDDGAPLESAYEGKALADMCEYLGYGHVDPYGFYQQYNRGFGSSLSKEFETLSGQYPDKIGFAILDRSFNSIMQAIKTYFGKNQRK